MAGLWQAFDKLDGKLLTSLQQVTFDKLAAIYSAIYDKLTSPLQACDKLGGKLMATLQQVPHKHATNLRASK